MGISEIINLAGSAIVQGYAEEIIKLNKVVAFDMRFNLRHPKIEAIYILEIPINGCYFEVVKRDGTRYHVGGDIAAKILGEEKSYMSNLEQMAMQAKEQGGLIKQFCRKCDLFSQLYPKEADEQELKDRKKRMEDEYLEQAGSVMSTLAKADTALPELPKNDLIVQPVVVSAAVSDRLKTKVRTSCEIQYTVAQTHLGKWLDFLESKRGHVLSKTENFLDRDPTGSLKLEAFNGNIKLSRGGKEIGTWDTYEGAHRFMRLGTATLPNKVLPFTEEAYENTIATIGIEESIIRTAIRSQLTKNVCTAGLWSLLNL